MIFARLYLYGWMLGLSFPTSAMLDSYIGMVFPLPTEDTHSEEAFDGALS